MENTEYSVVRIRSTTLERIKSLAKFYGISPPKMLDRMLKTFEKLEEIKKEDADEEHIPKTSD